jgi:hypothetical protein
MNLFKPKKQISLDLDGLDGNAFVIMGAFSKQAKRESWPQSDIDLVLTEAKKSDYDHLLITIMEHIK